MISSSLQSALIPKLNLFGVLPANKALKANTGKSNKGDSGRVGEGAAESARKRGKANRTDGKNVPGNPALASVSASVSSSATTKVHNNSDIELKNELNELIKAAADWTQTSVHKKPTSRQKKDPHVAERRNDDKESEDWNVLAMVSTASAAGFFSAPTTPTSSPPHTPRQHPHTQSRAITPTSQLSQNPSVSKHLNTHTHLRHNSINNNYAHDRKGTFFSQKDSLGFLKPSKPTASSLLTTLDYTFALNKALLLDNDDDHDNNNNVGSSSSNGVSSDPEFIGILSLLGEGDDTGNGNSNSNNKNNNNHNSTTVGGGGGDLDTDYFLRNLQVNTKPASPPNLHYLQVFHPPHPLYLNLRIFNLLRGWLH